jgi:hypothetical protein
MAGGGGAQRRRVSGPLQEALKTSQPARAGGEGAMECAGIARADERGVTGQATAARRGGSFRGCLVPVGPRASPALILGHTSARRLEFSFGVLPGQADQLDAPVRQHARHGEGAFDRLAPRHHLGAEGQAHADLRPAPGGRRLLSCGAGRPRAALKHARGSGGASGPRRARLSSAARSRR